MKLSIRILLGFSIVLILSIIDTTSNYLLSVKVERNSEFLIRSQEVIRNSARLHKSLIDMQNSFRGYLLTQDTAFLDGFNAGLIELPGLFVHQRELIKDDSEQLLLLDTIKALYSEWLVYTEPLIQSRNYR